MRAANPYNYNLPVEPEMFFGRQEDVEILTRDLLSTPGNSFALVGGRRMGKTSLLEALRRALQTQAGQPGTDILPLIIFLDLTGEGIKSPVSFFCMVSEVAQIKLTDLLALPQKEAATSTDGQPPAPAFERALGKWTKAVGERLGRRLRLILLLDECEEIIEQPWATELYKALRFLLVGQATRYLIKVVMSGSHHFLTQVRQHGSPLRNVLKYHTLQVLDAQATRDLIIKPTRGVLLDEVVQAVIEQGGGHPFLTQYLMHHLWERGLERVTLKTVREVAAGFCHERNDFQDWTDGLGVSALRIYRLLTEAGGAITESQIRATLRPAAPDLLQALDALCYHGLAVRESDSGQYRISSKMFRDWFTANVAGYLEDIISERERLTNLLQILDKHFDEEELKTLCFDLDVDYDNLPAKGKVGKARELISHLKRCQRISDLVKVGRKLRPNAPW